MAEKAKKDNKNLIIGFCAVIAIVIVVIIAIVLATKSPESINDSYFVSDDSKYVLNLTLNYEEEYAPLKKHIVYYYSGDEITGVKTYYEYANAATAKEALDELRALEDLDGTNLSVDGKYIISVSDPSEYADLKASTIKQQIEFREMIQGLDLDDEKDNKTEEQENEE